jgi:hypothetical protein
MLVLALVLVAAAGSAIAANVALLGAANDRPEPVGELTPVVPGARAPTTGARPVAPAPETIDDDEQRDEGGDADADRRDRERGGGDDDD